MKLVQYLVIALWACSFPVWADGGKMAPAFNLSGLTTQVSLEAYKGKVVYLDFWASWCSPCKDSFPWMNKMQVKYESQGLVFIAVNVDRDKDDAEIFLQSTPANIVIAFDDGGATPKNYEVMGMPSAYVIDREGIIVHSHIGFNLDDIAEYEMNIQKTLSTGVEY